MDDAEEQPTARSELDGGGGSVIVTRAFARKLTFEQRHRRVECGPTDSEPVSESKISLRWDLRPRSDTLVLGFSRHPVPLPQQVPD